MSRPGAHKTSREWEGFLWIRRFTAPRQGVPLGPTTRIVLELVHFVANVSGRLTDSRYQLQVSFRHSRTRHRRSSLKWQCLGSLWLHVPFYDTQSKWCLPCAWKFSSDVCNLNVFALLMKIYWQDYEKTKSKDTTFPLLYLGVFANNSSLLFH